MLDSVDIDCAVNILAKQAVEVAQKTGTTSICTPIYSSILLTHPAQYPPTPSQPPTLLFYQALTIHDNGYTKPP